MRRLAWSLILVLLVLVVARAVVVMRQSLYQVERPPTVPYPRRDQ